MAKPKPTSSPKKQQPTAAPARPTPPESAARALLELRVRLLAIPAAAVLPVNTDVPHSVSIALGASPRIAELRPAAAEHLPLFDLANIDDLPSLAMAAWYAHLQWVASTDPGEPEFDALLARSTELRRTLLGDADALGQRGLIDAARVEEIRAGRGHLDTANDLVALSALFEEAWPRVANRTAATHDEVEESAVLGTKLLIALSRRGEAGAEISVVDDSEDLRARAFTALRVAYDQCRRAVGYLRWSERDADAIAPSLFSRRAPRRKRDDVADDVTTEAASGSDATEEPAGTDDLGTTAR
jgi:hypothetical protein